MPMKLKVFSQKWKCPRGKALDQCEFPQNFHRKKVDEQVFQSYVQMANWLDKNKKHKNKVMVVTPTKYKSLTAIKKVVFDGVDTWVENYGHV